MASSPKSCGIDVYKLTTSKVANMVVSSTSFGMWLRKSRSSRM